ncbi:MAG: DNA repair exonuclease [Desulfosalsimonadaceae bacterium]
MFRFIHAADIHLDSPMHKLEGYDGAPVEEFRLSTRRAFDNLVKLAVSEKVSFVLISGDLYDGDWKDYNTGLFFVSRMNRLHDAGIRVFITAGNHDAASAITRSLRTPDNVFFFPSGGAETRIMEEPPVAVHGRSFSAPAEKKDLSRHYPPPRPGLFNIGMLHTCATGRQGHEHYAPCTVEGLSQKGYDYWALGHVHQYEKLCADPPIVFPGNTQGRHIRECGARGCVLVTVSEQMEPSLEFVPTDVVRWAHVRVDAGECHSGYDVVDAFAGRLEAVVTENSSMPLAVRAEITGTSPAAGELFAEPERWTGEIRAAAMEAGGSRVWVEKVLFSCVLPQEREQTVSGGAVDELLALFDELSADPGARQELSAMLDDFSRKLPRELKEGPDAVSCQDPDWIGELLEKARPELVGRLMKKGGGK